jgi:hypothetical protein
LHLHTWVHIFCTVFTLLHIFPITSHLPLVPNPMDKTCSTLMSFNFVEGKREKWHFCLFKIKVVTQEVSLWYVYIYMYYNPNWFISIFFHSPSVLSYGGFSWFKNSIFIPV